MCIYVNTSDTVNLLSSKNHDGIIFIMGKANTVTKSTLYTMLQAADTYLTTCECHTLCNLHTAPFKHIIQRSHVYSTCFPRLHTANLPFTLPKVEFALQKTWDHKGCAPRAQEATEMATWCSSGAHMRSAWAPTRNQVNVARVADSALRDLTEGSMYWFRLCHSANHVHTAFGQVGRWAEGFCICPEFLL